MLTLAFAALGVVVLVLTILLGFRRQRVVATNDRGDPVRLYVHTAVFLGGGLLLILGPLLHMPVGAFVIVLLALGLIEFCNGLLALRRTRSGA